MPSSRAGKGGPKTTEGKQRSSLNGLKHGLTAVSPRAIAVIAAEVGVDFETIHAKLRSHFAPSDPLEDQLVARIARCAWRLALAETMERRVLDRNPSLLKPTRSLERVMRYERFADINLHRAITALRTKRGADNF